MKLFEKLKNALFEEEYVEVEEPKKKEKSVIAKKIETPERKKEPRKEVIKEEIEEKEEKKEVLSDRDLLKPDTEFKFPMTFEEEDFIEEEKPLPPKKEPKREEKPKAYQKPEYTFHQYGSYEKKEEKKVFRPSPIISPIYGILDQNYKKEEIVTKKEVRITSSYEKTHLDFDAVREKAYGDLTHEIGLSMSEEEKQKEKENDTKVEEDNLLFDMRDEDSTPTVEKVTVGDAEEYFQDLGLEYNIDYKDASKEKATGRRVNKIKEEQEEEPKKEETVEQDSKLEDNLFDLIDSMYDEER